MMLMQDIPARVTMAEVEVFYRDQWRLVKITVVKIQGVRDPVYSVDDYTGWPVEDTRARVAAIKKYENGEMTIINNDDDN